MLAEAKENLLKVTYALKGKTSESDSTAPKTITSKKND